MKVRIGTGKAGGTSVEEERGIAIFYLSPDGKHLNKILTLFGSFLIPFIYWLGYNTL